MEEILRSLIMRTRISEYRRNIPAVTRHSAYVGSMLGPRLRRWTNMQPTALLVKDEYFNVHDITLHGYRLKNRPLSSDVDPASIPLTVYPSITRIWRNVGAMLVHRLRR